MLTQNTLNTKPVNHDEIARKDQKVIPLPTSSPLMNAHFPRKLGEVRPFPKTSKTPMNNRIPKKVLELAKILDVEPPSPPPTEKPFDINRYLKECLFIVSL